MSSPTLDRTGLAAVHRAVSNAIDEHDAAALAALYESDGTLMPPSGMVIRGRSAIEDTLRAMFTQGLCGQRVEVDEFFTSGDLAVEIGRSVADVRDPATGSMTTLAGNYLIVHRRQADGSWSMSHDIWTSVPDGAHAD
ncbi:YybH family protein [Mycobacterium sp. SMC-18]|uniref:YybH family protein n=1 Tax=unclassified Mycobacterium TaxID=2642494 RepID=UPI0038773CDE